MKHPQKKNNGRVEPPTPQTSPESCTSNPESETYK
jgi:hypothetical protein